LIYTVSDKKKQFFKASKQRSEIKKIAMSNPRALPSSIVLKNKIKLTNEELMAAATDEADLQVIGRYEIHYLYLS
jgi:hypothetical protein